MDLEPNPPNYAKYFLKIFSVITLVGYDQVSSPDDLWFKRCVQIELDGMV